MKLFRINRKPRHLEDDEQTVLAAYLDRCLPKEVPWWHVPNGGKRNAREAGRLKKMGVKAGVVDNHFLMPDGKLGVIELKIKPNRPTFQQSEFLTWVGRASGMAATAYSMDEAVSILSGWLAKYGLSIPATNRAANIERRVQAAGMQ